MTERGIKYYDKTMYTLVATCSLILVLLNILRIVNVSVTYDEALTYNSYVTDSVHAIITNASPAPNNHILNTLLTKFFILLADNVFFLRMAALMGQIAFLYFSYKICALLFANRWLLLCSFLALNLHPLLFEFWGLCRGYSLANGFMMGSIYFLLRYQEDNQNNALVLSVACCIAAIYANFTLLNLYPPLLLAIAISSRHIRLKPLSMSIPIVIIGTFVLFKLVDLPIRRLKEAHQFYYGGDAGFFEDTVKTLVQDCFYLNDGVYSITLISVCILASVILFSGYGIWRLIKKKDIQLFTLLLLLIIPALCTVFQHQFMSTKYLISRTALFFLPLYLLVTVTAISSMRGNWQYIAIATVLLISSANFLMHYNIRETRVWAFDRYDNAIMDKIQRDNGNSPITLGSYRFFTPVLEYYARTRYPQIFSKIENVMEYRAADTAMDYYYIEKKDMAWMPATYRIDTIVGNVNALIVRKK